ncbi:hypothetical protein SLI_6207 [Streptomyces lividans 1326]|uniref:Uncharacterized protein n=1 Tax=Streptomyces lividans 1326 TaxID=1200984 RepID=A0A7U9DVI7_STRLI|nr:hypothetical protein SLI_6207 [Streptomyces lividans 1326]
MGQVLAFAGVTVRTPHHSTRQDCSHPERGSRRSMHRGARLPAALHRSSSICLN